MAFTRLEYQKTWLSNTDFPTHQDSEQKVREDMQYMPDAVMTFINDVLLPALENPSGAAQIGDEQKGNLAATLADVYAELERLDEDIRDIADGETPGAWRSVVVDFETADWTEFGSGYDLYIPQSVHNRVSSAFGFRVWQNTGGRAVCNTWLASCASAMRSDETGIITVTAEEPFDGYVVFFGV